MSPSHFIALVPVKPLWRAKSRLGSLSTPRREALAAAFASDTLTSVLRATTVAQVLVVTDDPEMARRALTLGAEVIPDGVGGDLNGSLVQAAAEARRRWPHLQPVVVCADLPGMSSDDLDAVLRHADGKIGAVPDARGDGTTIYTAPGDRFAPEFGPDSFSRHLAQGAATLPAAAGARLDVDEPDDLARAVTTGVGLHTSTTLATLDLPEDAAGPTG